MDNTTIQHRLQKLKAFFQQLEKDEWIKKQHYAIHNKGSNDIVTTLDIALETKIIDYLKVHFPTDNILSEESFEKDTMTIDSLEKQKIIQPTWIIDPLDGTVNFAHHIPLYGVQLALVEKDQTLLTYLYIPFTKEHYYASKGQGAYLNDNKLIAKNTPIAKSIVSFGDFSHSAYQSQPIQIEAINQLKNQVMKIRLFGSSCIDFSYVASNKTQAHIMFSKRIWEFKSGILLAEESGCITGKIPCHHDQKAVYAMVVCQNKALFDYIFTLLQSI